MFKNYFKIAWRNLIKGKGFSIINIMGLAIGMGGAILILLWLQNEVSYDRFHRNEDRLYEVYGLTTIDGEAHVIDQTEQPLGPALEQNFPEVEATSRIVETNSFLLTVDDRKLTGIDGGIADPDFLRLFTFPLVAGDKNNQMKDAYSMVITEDLAQKLFGNDNPLNKSIQINATDHFTVTGVLKKLPGNTRFHFEYLLPWNYLNKLGWSTDSWLSNSVTTFVLLKPNVDVTGFNLKIKDIARQNTNRNDLWTHFLYPLSKWHLYSGFENGKPIGGRIVFVRLFGIIAAFILLIACINFMNLSTAKSEKRAKEIAIQKVSGISKRSLISQFISESLLVVFFAGIVALILVQLALPVFNTIINAQLSVPYTNLFFWLSAFIFILFTGFLAGSYPAFYLSSFNPVGIFQGKFKKNHGPLSTRQILVVVQFTFAVILIISTVIVRNQIRYAQQREMGYSGNNLVYVKFTGDIEKNFSVIKQELMNSGVVASVTKTMAPITERGANSWGFRWSGKKPGSDETIALYSADAGLVKTTGLQLIAGRDIDINEYPTDSLAVVLNETAVKTMGFDDPLGQTIAESASHRVWHVVGVVKDYIINSPYENIPPLVIEGPNSWFNGMHLKFNAAYQTEECLAKTAKIFKEYNPAYPFDYKFIDQEYAEKFTSEQHIKALTGLFASLAVIISCLGLLGLSAFIAESRVREIGVRKVFGASVADVMGLLSVDFVKLVIVAVIIGSPVTWYIMNRWLQNYDYHAEIKWSVFLAAGILVIAIALLTISFQSIKAALTNPSKSLRTD